MICKPKDLFLFLRNLTFFFKKNHPIKKIKLIIYKCDVFEQCKNEEALDYSVVPKFIVL